MVGSQVRDFFPHKLYLELVTFFTSAQDITAFSVRKVILNDLNRIFSNQKYLANGFRRGQYCLPCRLISLATQIAPNCPKIQRLSLYLCKFVSDTVLSRLSEYCTDLRCLEVFSAFPLTELPCLLTALICSVLLAGPLQLNN